MKSPITPLYGTAKATMHCIVTPQEKDEKELFVVQEFAKIRNIDGFTLLDVRKSQDDTHKKSDVFCKLDDMQIGIQVTELKYPDHAKVNDVTSKVERKLIAAITQKICQTDERVLVHIVSDSGTSDSQTKLSDKEIILIAESIAEGIRQEKYSATIYELLTPNNNIATSSLIYLDIPAKLKGRIKRVWLERIPDGMDCYRPGANGIFLAADISTCLSSNERLSALIDDIHRKKNNGSSHMLLIWSGDCSLYGDAMKIARLLCMRFKRTSFTWVYYFAFIEADTFFKTNRKPFRIK